PRTDDVLQNVSIPTSRNIHPRQSQPSLLEKIHAARVANLPLRNSKGMFDEHTPPDLSSSEAIADYIQMRTAEWDQHLQRRRERGGATLWTSENLLQSGAGKQRRKNR